jgi:Transglutaminase-like superfamily
MLEQTPRAMQLDALRAADMRFLKDVQHVFGQIKWATRDRATCLMMVLVARWMLNNRRIPGTIYLGVRRDPAKPGLHAHAWMQSAIGVVGHEQVDNFVIVEEIGNLSE